MDPCHNTVPSVARSTAQSSRCSRSVIVSPSAQSLWSNSSRPLTFFTWRVSSNRACCLSGRLDGWSHGWLPGRLSAHLWLSLTPSYAAFLACAVHLFRGRIPWQHWQEAHQHLFCGEAYSLLICHLLKVKQRKPASHHAGDLQSDLYINPQSRR